MVCSGTALVFLLNFFRILAPIFFILQAYSSVPIRVLLIGSAPFFYIYILAFVGVRTGFYTSLVFMANVYFHIDA
jgi:hypothetical protein